MAFTPRVADMSWIAKAGQQFASTIMKMPEAIEADKVLSENKVGKDELYEGFGKYVKSIPDNLLEKGGLNREKLVQTMPGPSKRGSEDTKMFSRKWMAWYIPIVETMAQNGATPEELQALVTSLPGVLGASKDPQIKGAIGGAQKQQTGELVRDAAAGQPGMMFGPEGGARPGEQPVPSDQPQPMEAIPGAIPEREKPTTREGLMGAVGELAKERGVGTPPTGAQVAGATQYQALPAAQKPITAYQQASLDIARMKHGESLSKSQETQTRQEHQALQGDVASYSGSINSAASRQARQSKRLTEIPNLIEQTKQSMAEALDPKEKTAISKELKALFDEQKMIEKDNEQIAKELPKLRKEALIAQAALRIYTTTKANYGEAEKLAREEVEQGAKIQPIGPPAKKTPAVVGGGKTNFRDKYGY